MSSQHTWLAVAFSEQKGGRQPYTALASSRARDGACPDSMRVRMVLTNPGMLAMRHALMHGSCGAACRAVCVHQLGCMAALVPGIIAQGCSPPFCTSQVSGSR